MLPALFNPEKLQTRIVAVYLGLLLVIQAVSYWFIQDSIDHNARTAIRAELTTSERVFLRLLGQNNANLDQATRVLSADYGFRSAVASGDQETVQSALVNNSDRIHANLALFTDNDFQLKASTIPQADHFLAAVRRYASQMQAGGAQQYQVEVIDGQPYQIVAVPVRAPATIGWVGMGFKIDRQLLQDMNSLSGMEVALMLRENSGDWRVVVATMDTARWPDVAAAWEKPINDGDAQGVAMRVGGTEYSALPVTLPGAPGQSPTTALLMRSVDKALEPFNQLKFKLLLLTAVGLAVFAMGSLVTARRITTPLRVLSSSARRLERGDYGAEVRTVFKGEIGELAQSFETMRQAIQAREGEIRRLAYQDALTDLPNREQFRHDLRQAIQKADEDGTPCAVLLLDMDRFKHVNDVLGHRFGDRLLRAVAERLRNDALTERDVLARLSGDEFAILLQATDAKAAFPVAQRILAAFERPITLDDHTVDLGAGIGVASSPEHGVDADTLLSRAEVAMYAAKQNQSGTVTYHPGLDSTSEESLTMLSELRSAVDQQQLRLFLQPKINLRTGEVLGAEALVRWEHPVRGMVPPMRFIPFAEQTGFVRVLTMWMIEQVAQMSHALTEQGMRMKLAVNLSTRDLMDQELPVKLEKVLERYSIDPGLLVLEITESAIMDDPQRALQTLNRLHTMGLKLSIDDFGTGYSSLAYLKRLPVDELKIDKSFVMNMESDLQDAKIVRSTVDLAHNLGLTVVAEGVESAKSWKLLDSLSCDEVQGYFIAKPMPGAQFANWVKQWVPPDTTHEHLPSEFADMF
ncbi:diguanylate phosphodiesterase [Aquabacterium sp. NJ1]|uniref:putative bifunctional diguanylate cyclase/phosphodiesterase n=1 Tax=Aquabacterium sp. NJ1 TaxID=1538295 RepID=UPI00052CAAFE|nr:EAL domain-containing protein [Aquabacterium sp. NJ1]KGM40296.1 diguanylate phosphodiesterase [Aquabacterium sp. NJ1]